MLPWSVSYHECLLREVLFGPLVGTGSRCDGRQGEDEGEQDGW